VVTKAGFTVGGNCNFREYFSKIMLVSFIGGENQRTQRKSLTSCITWGSIWIRDWWQHVTSIVQVNVNPANIHVGW